MRLDLHQHVWTSTLLDALSARTTFPFVRRSEGITILFCDGEQPYVIDEAAESAACRRALLDEDELDGALVALSSPIGIEGLPRAEATGLIQAHLEGVKELGDRFGAWGPLPLDQPQPEDVEALLERGCAGISIAAGALGDPARLRSLRTTLGRVAEHGVPLFVHPGPAPANRVRQPTFNEPLWWQALTDYISQMQAAWLTFATHGRRRHPSLQVVFAMLAGGAPLQAERLVSRGGPAVALEDGLAFYDTSSYGAQAVELLGRLVGPEQLVYGSDRPVVEPVALAQNAALQRRAAEIIGDTGPSQVAAVTAAGAP